MKRVRVWEPNEIEEVIDVTDMEEESEEDTEKLPIREVAEESEFNKLKRILDEDSKARQERELACQRQDAQVPEEHIDYNLPTAIWRHGPAKLWYDQLGIPVNATEYNYLIALLRASMGTKAVNTDKDDLSDEMVKNGAFDLCAQTDWESSIIWNVEDFKPDTDNIDKDICKQGPSTSHYNSNVSTYPNSCVKSNRHEEKSDWDVETPVINSELMSNWEQDIIWDAGNILKPNLLTPKIPAYDLDILDIRKVQEPKPPAVPAQLLNVLTNTTASQGRGRPKQKELCVETKVEPKPLDPFNISNDENYARKGCSNNVRDSEIIHNGLKIHLSKKLLKHAGATMDLHPLVISTKGIDYKTFHRPALKKYKYGRLARDIAYPVTGLYNPKKSKKSKTEQTNGVNKTKDYFTGKNGRMILMEYSEQYPPLLNEVGMCSRISNYWRKSSEDQDSEPPNLTLGRPVLTSPSTFLGELKPGEVIQTIENNMYRAPIYEHKQSPNDFVLIRTNNGYSLREFDNLFTVGQECPLMEVPNPRTASTFTRDLILVVLYQLLHNSRAKPPEVPFTVIKTAFPQHSESFLRRVLKNYVDFKTSSNEKHTTRLCLKPDAKLPSKEAIRGMISPEECCTYFSQVAGKQRLEEAGYERYEDLPVTTGLRKKRKLSTCTTEKEDQENQDIDTLITRSNLEEEIQCAPWNTTKAYIEAMKGKCNLQLDGAADPTGRGEGFSYVAVPNKIEIPAATKCEFHKLTLDEAKARLKAMKIPKDKVDHLCLESAITLLKRKMRAEHMQEIKNSKIRKMELQKKYKDDCQYIFEKQNRILSSSEMLKEDNDDDEAIQKMGKEIEKRLDRNLKFNFENEEIERLKLLEMMKCGNKPDQIRTNATRNRAN